jgi:hypothetical protein
VEAVSRLTLFPSMLIGYARVSTDDQDSALQRDALTKAGCEKIFDEIMSGGRADRPVNAIVIRTLNMCHRMGAPPLCSSLVSTGRQ